MWFELDISSCTMDTTILLDTSNYIGLIGPAIVCRLINKSRHLEYVNQGGSRRSRLPFHFKEKDIYLFKFHHLGHLI